jgi:hypothetical protein
MKKVMKVNKYNKKYDYKKIAGEAVREKWNEDAGKKLKLPIKEIMNMKIVKETPVGYVKLDIEMSPTLHHYLIRYAEQFMKKEEKEDLLVEWAFVNLLKRHIEKL